METVSSNILPQFISNQDPNIARAKLVSAVIDHPDVRNKLLELSKGYYTILKPGEDTVTYSDFSVESAESHISLFEKYLNEHIDDIEALNILYNDKDNVITKDMLLDLGDKLLATDPLFKTDFLWDFYDTLRVNKKLGDRKIIPLKNKNEKQTLTNLIQLVRFAYKKEDTLQAINGIIAQRFGLYTGQHVGNVKRVFTDDQIDVLRQIADFITQTGCITRPELFAFDRNLCAQVISIYSKETVDSELTYFSKFLLGLKAA